MDKIYFFRDELQVVDMIKNPKINSVIFLFSRKFKLILHLIFADLLKSLFDLLLLK